MTEKKRICETCAWWAEAPKDSFFDGECLVRGPSTTVVPIDQKGGVVVLYFPVTKKDAWCRYWSEITGWDQFKEMPTDLEKSAYIIFKSHYPDKIPADIVAWMEEYRRRC